MILRKATINDLDLIEYWDKKPHVLAAIGEDEYEKDEWMENQLKNPSQYVEIYMAMEGLEPIGLIQIVDPANEESHYWGEVDEGLRAIDIWIGEEINLGRGYGTKMMELALEKCFTNVQVKAVLVDPLVDNKGAIKFYEKIGFEFVKNIYFDEDHCSIYLINRENYEKLY